MGLQRHRQRRRPLRHPYQDRRRLARLHLDRRHRRHQRRRQGRPGGQGLRRAALVLQGHRQRDRSLRDAQDRRRRRMEHLQHIAVTPGVPVR
ncbi:hypothetical protein SBRY_20846 [Actinacidiphila bryophytorum]|uniref:Uncharacterized protein n=1 Tax=Actinacidiphila bryophytorum TaxID=1436133 RepID=A0A9W4E9Y7_9ACTN|nr:hypothetical protein SBRY_20846 [Actinacidiphila bryophytorum]